MDITVKNFQSKIPISVSSIKTISFKVSRALGLSKHKSVISIALVGPIRMRQINKKYLKHDYVTDVITFDYRNFVTPERFNRGSNVGASSRFPIKAFGNDKSMIAEIIICPVVASQNAKAYGISVKKEILLYVVHGLLHLAGYDDHSPKDIQTMRAKQELLLNRFL